MAMPRFFKNLSDRQKDGCIVFILPIVPRAREKSKAGDMKKDERDSRLDVEGAENFLNDTMLRHYNATTGFLLFL